MPVGHKLRELRRDRKLTVRAVEQATFRIAEVKNNKRFIVSNGWLTRLERGQSEPNIYKLFSLSVVYNIKVESLLTLYGIDVAEIDKLQSIAHPGPTQLLSQNLISDLLDPIQESDTHTSLLWVLTSLVIRTG